MLFPSTRQVLALDRNLFQFNFHFNFPSEHPANGKENQIGNKQREQRSNELLAELLLTAKCRTRIQFAQLRLLTQSLRCNATLGARIHDPIVILERVNSLQDCADTTHVAVDLCIT